MDVGCNIYVGYTIVSSITILKDGCIESTNGPCGLGASTGSPEN